MSIRPPQKAFNPEEARKFLGGQSLDVKEDDNFGKKSFYVFKK